MQKLFIYLFEMLDATVGSVVFKFNKGFLHLLFNFYMWKRDKEPKTTIFSIELVMVLVMVENEQPMF